MRAGLIGHPVGHSISPVFQQAAFDALSLQVVYERWDTPPELLQQRISELRADEFLGANVTVPHKRAVVSWLDETTADVQLTGAANTIVKRNERLVGYNTDVGGFRRALSEDLGYDAVHKSVAVLGAGGRSAGCRGRAGTGESEPNIRLEPHGGSGGRAGGGAGAQAHGATRSRCARRWRGRHRRL